MSKDKTYRHIDQRCMDIFVRLPVSLDDLLIALAVDPLAAEDAYEQFRHNIPHSIEVFAAGEPHVLTEMKETIATWVKSRGRNMPVDQLVQMIAAYDPWLAMWCLLPIAAQATARCNDSATEMVLKLADRWMMNGRPEGELKERLMLFRRELQGLVNIEDIGLRRCALCVLGATYVLVDSNRDQIVYMNGATTVLAARILHLQAPGEDDQDHRDRALRAVHRRWVDLIAKRVMQYPI